MSFFPDGAAGAALLLLRLSCALIAFPVLAGLPLSAPLERATLVAAVLLAVPLVIGFGTRVAATVLAAIAFVAAFMTSVDVTLALARIGFCTALVLLGPGAYSIDARLFGRRVIRLEPRAPNRGSDD